MNIDILIIIITLVLAFLGYQKGFIVSILNLIVMVAYFYFSSQIIDFLLNNFSSIKLIGDIEGNYDYRFIFIGVLGLIVFLISNLIFRKIIKKSFISGLDKFGGLLISLFISYLLICLASTTINSLSLFIDVNEMFNDSFFFSEQFNEYNLIYWWRT